MRDQPPKWHKFRGDYFKDAYHLKDDFQKDEELAYEVRALMNSKGSCVVFGNTMITVSRALLNLQLNNCGLTSIMSLNPPT